MKRLFLALAPAILFGLSPVLAFAQYPTKPIRLIVPFAPGGATDTLARTLGQKLSERLGQPVYVENRPGGNTFIGAELVAKSPPDGYTLLVPIDATLTMNAALYSKLPYDPVKSFAPVSILTRQSLLLSVHPKLAMKSVKQLVEYAKANPGKLNYGTGAITGQVAAELFKFTAGIDIVAVRYKGAAPAIQALLAGDIDMVLADIASAIPHVREGRLHGVATTGPQRAQALPDLPTVAEQGYPDYEVRYWFGLVAPSETPRSIINKLNAEVRTSLNVPEVKNRLATFGLEANPTTPEEFAAVIKSDIERWAKVLSTLAIHLE